MASTQAALEMHDAELARLAGAGGKGEDLDAATLRLRCETQEAIILQLNQQVRCKCIF